MAKRKATGRARKAARASTRKATRKTSRKPARRRAARQAARGTKKSARRKAGRRPARKPRAAAKATKKARSPRRRRAVETRPKPVALNRERRRLRDDETMASAPSTLGYAPRASGADSGHKMYNQRMREHTEGGPALTGGDVDSDWNDAYASGEETPGGDMPTPDQDVVEEIGRALGVEYDDAEELKGAPKIEERDRHRWEYDPASAEDYKDRTRRDDE